MIYRLTSEDHSSGPFPTREGEKGASLISVMVASTIMIVIALGMSRIMGDASKNQSRIENMSELTMVQSSIKQYIDCDTTLDRAILKHQIDTTLSRADQLKALCNATGAQGAGLLPSKSMVLYRKGGVPLTSALDPAKDSSGRLGIWWLRAGCDYARASMVVHAARFIDGSGKKFRKDPITNADLDWNNDKTILFSGAAGELPLCSKEISGSGGTNSGLSSFKSYFMDRSGEVTFEAPRGTRFTEILVDGQWQGKGDGGEDFYTAKILVDLNRKEYTGTQIVKIGSGDKKSQTVHWKPTPIGSAPKLEGLENLPEKEFRRNGKKTAAAKFFDQRFPKPLLQAIESSADGPQKFKFSEKNVDDTRRQNRFWNSGVMIKHYGEEAN